MVLIRTTQAKQKAGSLGCQSSVSTELQSCVGMHLAGIFLRYSLRHWECIWITLHFGPPPPKYFPAGVNGGGHVIRAYFPVSLGSGCLWHPTDFHYSEFVLWTTDKGGGGGAGGGVADRQKFKYDTGCKSHRLCWGCEHTHTCTRIRKAWECHTWQYISSPPHTHTVRAIKAWTELLV